MLVPNAHLREAAAAHRVCVADDTSAAAGPEAADIYIFGTEANAITYRKMFSDGRLPLALEAATGHPLRPVLRLVPVGTLLYGEKGY